MPHKQGWKLIQIESTQEEARIKGRKNFRVMFLRGVASCINFIPCWWNNKIAGLCQVVKQIGSTKSTAKGRMGRRMERRKLNEIELASFFMACKENRFIILCAENYQEIKLRELCTDGGGWASEHLPLGIIWCFKCVGVHHFTTHSNLLSASEHSMDSALTLWKWKWLHKIEFT